MAIETSRIANGNIPSRLPFRPDSSLVLYLKSRHQGILSVSLAEKSSNLIPLTGLLQSHPRTQHFPPLPPLPPLFMNSLTIFFLLDVPVSTSSSIKSKKS